MAKRKKPQIFSIFGQIEEAAAEHMIEKGKATRIAADLIPPHVSRDEYGNPAKFAVCVAGEHVAEFERICAELRA